MARPAPALVAEAEAIVAHVRALRRDLCGPFADVQRSGLTGPQVTVMACLVGSGPSTLTELSRKVGMSHSTASGIVDRLQARGLVHREQDPADRRRTQIAVTPDVTRYVREMEEGPPARLAAALQRTSAEQRAAIREGLVLLRQLLKPDGHGDASADPLPDEWEAMQVEPSGV